MLEYRVSDERGLGMIADEYERDIDMVRHDPRLKPRAATNAKLNCWRC
jgi:hypothetical protein